MPPKKKLAAIIKLQIQAGAATPAPPVGPALGQHGVNIGAFVKQFNDDTRPQAGMIIPVLITVYKDRTFTPCGRENDEEGLHPYGNPDGKWTFGRLMKALAGKTDPKTFLKSWILLIDPRPSTTVNTFPISPRPRLREKLLRCWIRLFGKKQVEARP